MSLGTYLTPQPQDGRRLLQLAGSIAIVGATVLLVAAFFYEPLDGNLNYTPFTHNAAYLIAAGTLARVVAATAGKGI